MNVDDRLLRTIAAAREWLRVNAGPPRDYSTFEFGRDRDTANVSVVLPEQRARELLPNLRRQLAPGLVAFIGTSRWLGDEQHRGVELVVAPGASQFDILRVARSDACNYDLDTEQLIERLTDFERRFGIVITHAETDTIEFGLGTTPEDWQAFAQELYEFCPDIVDQGTGSVEALAAELRERGAVFLWWD
jgi:hypothetical protein